jgi:hypothetical protein
MDECGYLGTTVYLLPCEFYIFEGAAILGRQIPFLGKKRADALVTHNLADFAGAAERFRILVLCPGELLKKVRVGTDRLIR